jgi:hypothetical protein
VPAVVSAQPDQAIAARTVLAAVLSGAGRPVVDVGVDDFVVSEGGEPREVLDVHVADYPLALVIDDRPAAAASLPAIRQSALRFVERVGKRPIALLTLSDGSGTRVSLDDERSVLVDRLGAVQVAPTASVAPLDVIARAADQLKQSGAQFSGVVVITGAPVDASARVSGELLPQIIDSGASVHVIELTAVNAGPPSEPDLMTLVSDQTRGQSTTIYSSASYGAALDRLADRLAIEMMVEYIVPPGPRAGDVRVGVRVPGARVVGLGVK